MRSESQYNRCEIAAKLAASLQDDSVADFNFHSLGNKLESQLRAIFNLFTTHLPLSVFQTCIKSCPTRTFTGRKIIYYICDANVRKHQVLMGSKVSHKPSYLHMHQCKYGTYHRFPTSTPCQNNIYITPTQRKFVANPIY